MNKGNKEKVLKLLIEFSNDYSFEISYEKRLNISTAITILHSIVSFNDDKSTGRLITQAKRVKDS